VKNAGILLPPTRRLFFIFVSYLVCLLARLCKNYSTDVSKNRRKGSKHIGRERSNNGGNPDHVTLGLRLRLGGAETDSAKYSTRTGVRV